jgi:hypothetical protein
MDIAYFDCFSGVSGDMALGASIDLGVPVEALNAGMKQIGGNPASDQPNLLRVWLGQEKQALLERNLPVIETNIDDMNPEFYNYVRGMQADCRGNGDPPPRCLQAHTRKRKMISRFSKSAFRCLDSKLSETVKSTTAAARGGGFCGR